MLAVCSVSAKNSRRKEACAESDERLCRTTRRVYPVRKGVQQREGCPQGADTCKCRNSALICRLQGVNDICRPVIIGVVVEWVNK